MKWTGQLWGWREKKEIKGEKTERITISLLLFSLRSLQKRRRELPLRGKRETKAPPPPPPPFLLGPTAEIDGQIWAAKWRGVRWEEEEKGLPGKEWLYGKIFSLPGQILPFLEKLNLLPSAFGYKKIARARLLYNQVTVQRRRRLDGEKQTFRKASWQGPQSGFILRLSCRRKGGKSELRFFRRIFHFLLLFCSKGRGTETSISPRF